MFNVVLVAPKFRRTPAIRLCANTGARLHLIEPLGFRSTTRGCRAGLDYHEYAQMRVHRDWDAFIATETPDPARMFAFTTRGSGRFHDHAFLPGDWFVFGSETRGLSAELLERFPNEQRVRLPMRPDNRSLNLSNTVAVVVFEAWRPASKAAHDACTAQPPAGRVTSVRAARDTGRRCREKTREHHACEVRRLRQHFGNGAHRDLDGFLGRIAIDAATDRRERDRRRRDLLGQLDRAPTTRAGRPRRARRRATRPTAWIT